MVSNLMQKDSARHGPPWIWRFDHSTACPIGPHTLPGNAAGRCTPLANLQLPCCLHLIDQRVVSVLYSVSTRRLAWRWKRRNRLIGCGGRTGPPSRLGSSQPKQVPKF
jgi:hypothetical protein